jgi:hypothetical protein
MTTHELKIWPHYFEETLCGAKTAQLRRNDRAFQIGDRLLLREFVKESGRHTGRETTVVVTDVIQNCDGLVEGYCVLSIRLQIGALMNYRVPDPMVAGL